MAALVVILGGCAQGGERGGGCAGEAHNPHISEPSHDIVAKSTTGCEGVRSVRFTMYLQRKLSTGWVTRTSSTVTISNPVDGREYTRQVVASCITDQYRHRIVVHNITLLNGTSIVIQDPTDMSQEVQINC